MKSQRNCEICKTTEIYTSNMIDSRSYCAKKPKGMLLHSIILPKNSSYCHLVIEKHTIL